MPRWKIPSHALPSAHSNSASDTIIMQVKFHTAELVKGRCFENDNMIFSS
jgi:hypothetical protein